MDAKREGWDGAPKYTYDVDSLKLGDIILSTSPAKESRAIRRFTKSPYSHAMLYAGRTIIHADINGVFTTNPQRLLFPEGTSRVFRLCNGASSTGAIACQFALNLTGSLYSVPEAMLSYLLRNTGRRSLGDAQFCSRLVAQAYAHAGINLVDNPDFCFPGELAKSELLQPVEGATRLATPPELVLAATPDTVRIHQEHTYAWLRPLGELAKQAGFERPSSIKSALEFIIAHPSFDAGAAELLVASKYLDDYNLDKIPNPHRYDLKAFEFLLLSRPSEGSRILDVEYDIAVDIANNAKSQYLQFRSIVKRPRFFESFRSRGQG